MDLKWLAVGLILAVAMAIYVRAMRVHAHASWGEIAFPWFRGRSKGGHTQHGGPAPAE